MKHIKVLIVLVLVSLFYLLSGCEILKNKRRTDAEQSEVNRSTETKVDSSAITKTSTEKLDAKTVWDWWKTTVQFSSGQSIDTTKPVVNNYLTAPQPQVIIMEGGKGQRDETTVRMDSTFAIQIAYALNEKIDSLSAYISHSEKKKESETKGVGLVALCLIGGGLVVLNRVLVFFANNYSINKN